MTFNYSILGKRDRSGEHEAMRKIKNEFMSMWDGLRSREGERVLVLAASNRPFDLDDAVLLSFSLFFFLFLLLFYYLFDCEVEKIVT